MPVRRRFPHGSEWLRPIQLVLAALLSVEACGGEPDQTAAPSVTLVRLVLVAPATVQVGNVVSVSYYGENAHGERIPAGFPVFSTSDTSILALGTVFITTQTTNGLAKRTGLVRVSVSSGGFTDNASIQVGASLRLLKGVSSLFPADTMQLTAEILTRVGGPPDTNLRASFVSRDPTVASVTTGGLVTSVVPGQAWIVAAFEGARDSVRITVLAPPVVPTIKIVSGGGIADTITAVLPAPLVAAIGGVPAGTMVRFIGSTDGSVPGATVSRVGQASFAASVDVPVGSDGRVAASVKLGTRVGKAIVRLTIPSSDAVDTAEYEVLAGAAFRLTLAPRDTLILTGKSFAVRAATVDRFGNPRAGAVTLSSLGPEATVAGGTIVAAQSGIGAVVGQVGQAHDTVRMFVVPVAPIAGTALTEAVVFRADGEVVKRIPFNFFPVPFTSAWSPDGTLLVLDASASGSGGPLRVIRPDGSVTPIGSPTGLSIHPRFSPDGQWIYYSREAWEIRRIHPDGSGDEFVYQGVLGDAVAPSISPDGTRMAWTGALGDVLSVRDLATGINTAIGVGHTSVWRPQGDQLAFIDTGDESVGTARPDGTERRRVSQTGFRYHLGVDWSADGVWLIAKSRSNAPNRPMHLIHFATGTTIALPFTDQWNAPAWSH